MDAEQPTDSDVLLWEDVFPAAKAAFSIWTDQPELKWAEKAWNIMVEKDLANYDSKIAYCEVCIRFLALASIYSDWCCMAFDECWEYDDIIESAELFDLNDFWIGALHGMDDDIDFNDWDDDPDIVIEAIRHLIRRYRDEVYLALSEVFNSTTELYSFFLGSLSVENDYDSPDPFHPEAVYGWIDAGCYPLR